MGTVADELRALGVTGILVDMAERGEISEVACAVEGCLCPRGTGYFVPVPPGLPDWMPTLDHYPKLKADGGQRTPENSRLAHRLCNRVDYARSVENPIDKDLARVEAERVAMQSEEAEPPGGPKNKPEFELGDSKAKFVQSIQHPNGPVTVRIGHDQWGYNIVQVEAAGGNLRMWISPKGNKVWVYPENQSGEAWLLLEQANEMRLMSSTERNWRLDADGNWVDGKGNPFDPRGSMIGEPE